MAVMNNEYCKFVSSSLKTTFALFQYLGARLGATLVEHLIGLHSKHRLPALPTNIRLGWKQLAMKNALVYYISVSNVTVKSFIIQDLGIYCSNNHIFQGHSPTTGASLSPRHPRSPGVYVKNLFFPSSPTTNQNKLERLSLTTRQNKLERLSLAYLINLFFAHKASSLPQREAPEWCCPLGLAPAFLANI